MNEYLLIEKPVVLLFFSHHFRDDLCFDDGVIAQYLLDKHETQVPCPELAWKGWYISVHFYVTLIFYNNKYEILFCCIHFYIKYILSADLIYVFICISKYLHI